MRKLLTCSALMMLCCAQVHSIASADNLVEQAEISFVNDRPYPIFINGIEVCSWETKRITLELREIFILREGFVDKNHHGFAHAERYKSIILQKGAKISISTFCRQSSNKVIFTQNCWFVRQ